MLVSLVKIDKVGNSFVLKEKNINKEDVSTTETSHEYKNKLKEGILPDNLSQYHEFTEIRMKSGERFVVVGSCDAINEKLGTKRNKMLLFD